MAAGFEIGTCFRCNSGPITFFDISEKKQRQLLKRNNNKLNANDMKTTDHFKKVISDHLQQLAVNDPLFGETLKKPNKNIDDCITYILNQVKASGCVGFADDEIFGMAVHYYDEDEVKSGKKISAKVVVNHTIELTEIEKEKARQIAIDKAVEEQKAKLIKKKQHKAGDNSVEQISLF